MQKFLLRHKYKLGCGVLLVILLVLYIVTSAPAIPPDIEVGVVEQGEVIEIVNETGTVQVARSVDMAFERTGRVAAILAAEGSKVAAGAPLIQLGQAGALAEREAAVARLEAEEIRLQELVRGADDISLNISESKVLAAELAVENAAKDLEIVTEHQDQLVENAHKALYSTGLEAYLIDGENVNSSDSYTSPAITGTYTGTEEGSYIIEVYASNAPSGSSFTYSGLEKGSAPVSALAPVPLGTLGLYIQFPEDYARRTTWEIPIPNVRSAAYINNLNAYKAVAEARHLAVATAENTLTMAQNQLDQARLLLTQNESSARSEQISAQEALVRQMRALVDQANVSVTAMTLTAPFAGTVTAIDTEVGAIASPGSPVVSIISNDQYEINVDVSEVDIAELNVGDFAIVSLDAYPDTIFSARVTAVAPNAAIKDGLRVFRITLAFDQTDILFKDGLTAEVDITTISKPDVIRIPTRSIYEDEQGKFVRTIDDRGQTAMIRITTGLRGSNGFTEVTSGLKAGDSIITFAPESSLKLLKDM